MQGLDGVRVLELGQMVSAAYATKLMGDLGADVIKIEEESGDLARQHGPYPNGVADAEQSGLFLALNTNKRSVVLDAEKRNSQLARLVETTDIVVHNYQPAEMQASGLDYQALSQINPRIVLCSITPFGLTGPYRNYKAYELTLAHAGGWAWLGPGASDAPKLPPLKTFGQQCHFQGGLAGAMASLAAYFHAQESGQGEHIDLSIQSYVASILEQNFVYYSYLDRVASRLGRRQLYPWGIFRAQDGLIFLITVEEDQWRRLVELMGRPEWANWEIFKDMYSRSKNHDVLKMYLEEWLSEWKVDDLFRAGQAQRICFAPVLSMAQLLEQPQLRDRNFFVEVEHPKAGKLTHLGPPYQLKEPWWKIRRPAPMLGEHSDEVVSELGDKASFPAGELISERAPLPLSGVRVVDFTWVWAGPHGTMQLAHLGAEVIKVESTVHTDMTRRVRLPPLGMEPGPNRSGVFNQWNQGKKSLQLNLGTARGLEIAKELIKKSDVVVDNFATGVMERMGLSYETLQSIKPDIIVASISGYGHSGPQKDYMGYGPAIAPLTGISSLTGHAGGPPEELGISYGDPNGGINAAVVICAALTARKRTGRGQYIDVSLWDAMAALVPEGWMQYVMNGTEPRRAGNRDLQMAPHNCYACKGEDEWVTIACGTDREWQGLCGAMSEPALALDRRYVSGVARKKNEDDLDAIISAWTGRHTQWEITGLCQAEDVAAFPSMNSKALAQDRHLAARCFFEELDHPEVGKRMHAGIPWLLTNSQNGVRSPAPLLGEHTEEILRDIVGCGEEEIVTLKRNKILE